MAVEQKGSAMWEETWAISNGKWSYHHL